jgi:tetratricopeptide (TPR) repeat protein
VLCGIAALFALRTIARNADYKDDVTLYTSAEAVTPNSAKVHFAMCSFLANRKPLSQWIDQAVAEAEIALEIVKDVPDRLNQAPLLVEASKRYFEKAEIVDPSSADGSRMPSPEAQMWYRKSLELLLRARTVDRLTAEDFHAADLARGKRPEEIPFYGLETVYWSLGKVQLRLGDGPAAVQSYLYERKFNPLKLEIYDNLGRAYLAANRLPDAAITFLQAQFLRESQQDTPEAIALYRMIDPLGCSLTMRNGQPAINYQCPLVLEHACAAFADLVKTFREANLPGVADSALKQAHDRFGCR